jgi:hypothetical protein
MSYYWKLEQHISIGIIMLLIGLIINIGKTNIGRTQDRDNNLLKLNGIFFHKDPYSKRFSMWSVPYKFLTMQESRPYILVT